MYSRTATRRWGLGDSLEQALCTWREDEEDYGEGKISWGQTQATGLMPPVNNTKLGDKPAQVMSQMVQYLSPGPSFTGCVILGRRVTPLSLIFFI